MKFATFNYTKANGSSSTGDILLEGSPSDNYSGTDLSELDPSDAVAYAQARNQLQKEYFAKIAELNNAFDLNYKFRQFKPTGMTNLVIEELEG